VENAKGQVVMWDSANTQAWLGMPDGKYKLSKSFKTNTQAKNYAMKLGTKFKAPVYDKWTGKYIGRYAKPTSNSKATKRTTRTVKRSGNALGKTIGQLFKFK